MKKSVKPEPVPVNVVCSLCGEPWSLHAEDKGEVSTLECIRLLKARANRIGPTYIPQPYPLYPQTWPWRYFQVTGGSTAQSQTWATNGSAVTTNTATPSSIATASAA